jgi:hypothetical protein
MARAVTPRRARLRASALDSRRSSTGATRRDERQTGRHTNRNITHAAIEGEDVNNENEQVSNASVVVQREATANTIDDARGQSMSGDQRRSSIDSNDHTECGIDM